jgi:hypothetical protein
MKTITLIIALCIFCVLAKAQKFELNGNDLKNDTLLAIETDNKSVYLITLKESDFNVDEKISWNDNSNNTAKEGIDYLIGLPENEFLILKSKPLYEFTVTILPDTTVEKNDEYFEIIFKDVKAKEVKRLTVQIKDKKNSIANTSSNEEEEYNKDYNRLMYLNAASFDFGSGGLGNSSYVGHLNILSPRLSAFRLSNKIKDDKENREGKFLRWGFNAGVMKINYLKNDSTLKSATYNDEKVLSSPFDSITVGGKFIRQYNKYSQKVSNTNWSIYFQPMINIFTAEDNKVGIYLHGHAELLISKWATETNIETLHADSITITTSIFNSNPVYRYKAEKNFIIRNTNLSLYYGVGITLLAQPWKNGRFCIQYTLGKTTDNYFLQNGDPRANRIAYEKSGYARYYGEIGSSINKFYLVRSYYSHKLGDNSNLYIGTDIRGFFPNQQPKYALYAGVDIDIEAVAKLFK